MRELIERFSDLSNTPVSRRSKGRVFRKFCFIPFFLLFTISLFSFGSLSAQEKVYKKGETLVWGTKTAFEAATGMKLKAYSEAPMLAKKVAAGELPPVAERLPEEVVVVDPMDEMGSYGGDYRIATITPGCCGDFELMFTRFQNILNVNPAIDDTIPNIAQGWELSSDFKSLKLMLRKGLKWSDGAPFTADDFIFWWEDFVLNEDLGQSVNPAWKPGGKPMKMTKVDDHTLQMDFAEPYPIVLDKLAFSPYARGRATFPVAPKHYLSKLHIKYNPNANADAKKAGFDDWKKRFLSVYANQSDDRNVPGFPTMEAWVHVRSDELGNRYFERNPYFWVVDTAGRQLPYIDTATVCWWRIAMWRSFAPFLENSQPREPIYN
jgi:peptide/nickel transport system substrate-binding protein